MCSFFRSVKRLHGCKSLHLLILLFWIFGMLAGACIGFLSVESAEQLIQSAVLSDSYSVFMSLAIRILPAFITILAVYHSSFIFLLVIVFFKALFVSYVCTLSALISTATSCLFCILLLFDEILLLPVLFYMWLGAFFDDKTRQLQKSCIVISIILIVSVFDFRYVDPLLNRLILL